MSSAVVRATFETHFKAAFPLLTVVELNNENPVYPKDGSGRLKDFVSLMFLGGENVTEIGGELGTSRWRETGTINLLLYTVAGTGAPVATADAIRTMFGGRTLNIASPGKRLALLAANPLSEYLPGATGPYSIGAVAIPYEYDFIR